VGDGAVADACIALGPICLLLFWHLNLRGNGVRIERRISANPPLLFEKCGFTDEAGALIVSALEWNRALVSVKEFEIDEKCLDWV
jgi:hypothetical protein